MKLVLSGISFAVALALALPVVALAQENWQVSLTKKQGRAAAQIAQQKQPTVMAISPDGAWGNSWGTQTLDQGKARAIQYCRQNLKPGQRDCMVYAVNGKPVLPAVVSTKRVSKVYKPLSARSAAAFFGLAAVNFRGNPELALADYQALKANPAHALRGDSRLQAVLKGKSLMHARKSPEFAIALEARGGEQHARGNSGVIWMRFDRWVATRDGLLCLYNRVWSTGKQAGTECYIINQIANGKVSGAWASKPRTNRPLLVIAGDARYGNAR